MRRDIKGRQARTLLRKKIYAEFNGRGASPGLPDLCVSLLTEQKLTWPFLRDGYESLNRIRERPLHCDGFSVFLQHNPGRMKSTMARVDEEDINRRKCFLCLHHLPGGQKGILYKDEYLILCNPMPVFPAHFTIARTDHCPQVISEHVSIFLQLMADFGPGWTILYNGPKCGASAPDHFHFQAVPSGAMPIQKEILMKEKLTPIARQDSVVFYRAKDVGREVIILEGDTQTAVGDCLTSFVNSLKTVRCVKEEPMINVAGSYEQAKWRLVIFPRSKHRPDTFFKKGPARIAVSPAVIEMGGVLVTPFARDFERLDAAAVESIYDEVSLKGNTVESAIHAILRPAAYSTSS